MKVEMTENRIYLIPETEAEAVKLGKVIPLGSSASVFFTYDAGKNGNEFALVVHRRHV